MTQGYKNPEIRHDNLNNIGRGDALVEFKSFNLEGRGFEHGSSRHEWTLGESLTRI